MELLKKTNKQTKKPMCSSLASFSGTRAAPLLPLPSSHHAPQGHHSNQRQAATNRESCCWPVSATFTHIEELIIMQIFKAEKKAA